MLEIEVKVLEVDGDRIRRILEVHGAKKKFSGTIVAHFFRGENGQKIRLRNMNGIYILTAKTRKDADGYLVAQEFEMEVGDMHTCAQILTLAGLTRYGESMKTRESYVWHDIVFDIDTYAGIPEYLEIEASSAEKVIEGLELLGYTMADTVTLTEGALRQMYGA